MTRDPLPGLGVPVVVAVDTDDARDRLARLHAGCDCPRLTRFLPGWPRPAAIAAVLHAPPCRPTELLEPRLVVLGAPRTPPTRS